MYNGLTWLTNSTIFTMGIYTWKGSVYIEIRLLFILNTFSTADLDLHPARQWSRVWPHLAWFSSESFQLCNSTIYHRIYHTEAWTKWPTFRRRYFQMDFVERLCLCFDSSFSESELPIYPGYFRKTRQLSMGLPEISRVTLTDTKSDQTISRSPGWLTGSLVLLLLFVQRGLSWECRASPGFPGHRHAVLPNGSTADKKMG